MKITSNFGLLFQLLAVVAAQGDSTSTFPPPPVAYGFQPNPGEYKWAVGVHRVIADEGGFEQICGGTLISSEVALSAAHCFWNDGKIVPFEEYKISVGNYLRDMEHDINTQKREIQRLIFHERYRGYQLNYAHDIVIVLLKEKVIYNSLVAPASIDLSTSFDDYELEGQVGIVVGWGLTESDEPSLTRVAALLPYVDFDTCWKTVPREFRSSITPDKFCAGLKNGTTVCPGDSGGGLAFFNNSDKKWYLRGIVSVGVVPEGNSKCRKSQFSAFVSISSYRSWLQKKLSSLNITLDSSSKSSNQTNMSTNDVLIFS